MPTTNEQKENIKVVYTQLCNSYLAIDDFRSKLLSLLPLATGGLFFFITDPGSLIGKAIKAGSDAKAGEVSESAILSLEVLQAIGWFGVMITLGLYCYELYGIRKCTALICLGERLEKALEIKGQFTMRPDGILHGYFGEKFNFIEINEPFAAGIIYPAVMAAWTFLALSRTGFATLPAILVFASLFLLSLWFMYWLTKHEIPRLETDLNLIETDSAKNNPSNSEIAG